MDWEPQGAGFEPPLDWGQGPVTPVAPRSATAAPSAVRTAAPSRYPTAREALHTVFGYDEFRGDQADIVEQVIAGGDAVVLMPTGGGKSITYQVPALVREGTGLVISPLIALIARPGRCAASQRVNAAYLNSTQAIDERREVEEGVHRRRARPHLRRTERLSSAQTTALLQRGTLSVIAIDEAHCVSQWGSRLPPRLPRPGDLGERFPGVPRMVSRPRRPRRRTRDHRATAARRREALRRELRPPEQSSIGSCPRSTRASSWSRSSDPRRRRATTVRSPRASCTRSAASRSSRRDLPRRPGLDALPYHAGLPAECGRRTRRAFLREDGVVMVAHDRLSAWASTKPTVRFVGAQSTCRSRSRVTTRRPVALVATASPRGLDGIRPRRRRAAAQLISTIPGDNARFKMRMGQHLDAMLALCETVECRRQNLLGYFGQESQPCGNCDTVPGRPETFDGLVPAQKLLSTIVRLKRERKSGVRRRASDRHPPLGPRPSASGSRATTSSRLRHRQRPLRPDWRSVVRQLLARGIVVAQGRLRHSRARRTGGRWCSEGESAVPLRKDTIGRPPPPPAALARPAHADGPRRGGSRTLRSTARLAGRDGARAGRARVHRLRRCHPPCAPSIVRPPSPTSTASPESGRRSARPTARAVLAGHRRRLIRRGVSA